MTRKEPEINPSTRTLLLYRRDDSGAYGSPTSYGEGDTVIFPGLPTLPLSVESLFSSAPDTEV